MWWKIYFWFFSGGFLLYLGLEELSNALKWTLYDWLCWIFIFITAVAIYSYAYKKTVYSFNFWRKIFWINIVWLVLGTVYYLTPLNRLLPLPDFLKSYYPIDFNDPGIIWIFIICILIYGVLPFYILYKLAYPQKPTKKLMS